ncbi:hypothetical protein ABE10_00210, partial [Bacillus toyonensis]|nr:hypothetical protein [Bacillus toyonensis]
MAEVVGLGQAGGAVEVSVEGQEDLIVLPDELVPQAKAVLGLAGAFRVGGDVQHLVAGEDDRKGGMLRDHPVRPVECGVRGAPGEGEHHELLALALEHVISAEPGRVAALIRAIAGGAVGAEPLQERLRRDIVGGVHEAVVAVEHIV